VVVSTQRFARHHERVPSSPLLGLKHEVNARMGHRRPHPVGLMTDDGVHVLCRDDPRGCTDHMLEQWLPADFM